MEKSSRALRSGLLIAMLLAGALRLADLGAVPVSLYCDEAFSGYEAYSLLETGRDSRGVLLPFFFDIFGKGWGEPLYIYLTVPAVALFGLTPFATRFVAAMAGTIAVPVTGLLCAVLLRRQTGLVTADRAGIASALLMAVSPWPFHLSRVAFQASLLPLALAAGFWLAARALEPPSNHAERVRTGLLLVGAALLGMSLYTYTVARLAMPILLAGFAVIYRRRLARAPRATALAAVVLGIMTAPIGFFSLTHQGQQRFSDVSILTRADVAAGGPISIASAVGANFLSYYSPRFLLTEGDANLRHSIRGHGMLHPHDLLLLCLGVAVCLLLRTRGALFLLWWLAVFPAAAALTVDPRHAVRSICGLPGIFAIEGLGFALIWGAARGASPSGVRRLLSLALVVLLVAVSALSASAYFHDYFVEYPIYSGQVWQYGLKEVYDFTESLGDAHDSIYITRYEDFPFIHLLFYRAFPPREYQSHRFSNTRYLFDQDRWVRGPGRLNPMFVWKPAEIPDGGVEVRRVIKYPDGTDAFVIAW